MQPHPPSFFDWLPYDIRAIVYKYLEPEQIPPFSPQSASLGFFLSCRQAKQELDELTSVSERLELLLSAFNKTASYGARIEAKPGTLRCITVYLPFMFGWKRHILASLHTLFAHYFELVHIHMANNPSEAEAKPLPKHDTLYEKGHFEVQVHGLLRDIAFMIQRVNVEQQETDAGSTSRKLHSIFGYASGREDENYAFTPVRTKRISLSWDFRSDSEIGGSSTVLNGRVHRMDPDRCRFPDLEGFAVRETDAQILDESRQRHDPETELLSTEGPIFYHLHSSERLVGEMCLQNNRCWPASEAWWHNRLLNGQETVSEYISSDGLARRPRRGLCGIATDDYEEREREIQHVLWAT